MIIFFGVLLKYVVFVFGLWVGLKWWSLVLVFFILLVILIVLIGEVVVVFYCEKEDEMKSNLMFCCKIRGDLCDFFVDEYYVY